MAAMSYPLEVLLIVIAALWLPSIVADECVSTLQVLQPCLSFVSADNATDTSPSKACCAAFVTVYGGSNSMCLCTVTSYKFLNATRVKEVPGDCGVKDFDPNAFCNMNMGSPTSPPSPPEESTAFLHGPSKVIYYISMAAFTTFHLLLKSM